jgi:hypothetical protein
MQRVPRERIVFCPIDISKDFHMALFHNIDCQPLSEFFPFSASEQGLQGLLNRLQATIQANNPTLVFIGMEPTDVYYANLLHNLHAKFYESQNPRVLLAIVDPGAVANNRKQPSLAYEKDDDLDCAAIGDLLTRGLSTPARLPEPLLVESKELSRLLKRRQKPLHTRWNQLLVRLARVFPNLLITYKNENPLCKDPLNSTLLDHLLPLCPDPYHLLSLTEEDLIELFHQNAWPLGPKGAEKISHAAGRALFPIKPSQEVHLQLFQRERKLIDSYRQEINEIIRQLQEKVRQTPARHLACIPGSSEH